MGFCHRKCTGVVLLLAIIQWILLSQHFQHTLQLSLLLQQQQQQQQDLRSHVSNTAPIHVQFIFIVGLEGTGHHLHQRIVKASPAFATLRHALPDYALTIHELHATLYNKVNGTGLWNLPCDMNWNDQDAAALQELVRRQRQVATVLERIQAQILPLASNKYNNNNNILRFPVNTVSVDRADTSMFGMCSYPNWGGVCRAQQYPRLGWFYEACDMAKVDCRHVYLYRNPADILYSTTIHRAFNPSLAQGIALYESIITHALLPDMTQYANQLLACVGFYDTMDDDDNINTNDNENYKIGNWKSTMQSLWLWRNATKFSAAMDRIYQPPQHHGVNHSLLEGLSLETWQKGHDFLLNLCYQNKNDELLASNPIGRS